MFFMSFIDLFFGLCFAFLVIVVWLFLTMSRVCLQVVNVVFPDRTHILFSKQLHVFSPRGSGLFTD